MRRFVYSRWDGTAIPFSLDADEALDELSQYLMEGGDAASALDWMRYQGFELAGMEFRLSSDDLRKNFFAFAVPLFADPSFNLLQAGDWITLSFSFGSEDRSFCTNRMSSGA